MLEETKTAVSLRYTLRLDAYDGGTRDGKDLGEFSSCEGLGCEVVLETREEGGNNSYVWQRPSRLKYSNVKLTRPLGADTAKISAWFETMASGFKPVPTGVLQAMNGAGDVIASWSLRDIVPVRWSGPSFNPDSPKVLTETLEIAHHGFTVSAGS